MSNMKCPFCQKELVYLADNFYCPNCYSNKHKYYAASPELWQELIRTRKALNVAVDALETFAQIPQPIAEVAKAKLYAIKALEQITALEQKEVK